MGTSPYAAALVNGTAAVRLELDEGNGFCANHPSAHTLPAVLATAEAVGADGMTFLAASAAAYEVAVRVGRGIALRPAVHPFGTAMVCGAALGVARLRGLDVATATRAVRLAAALVPASTQRAANQGATVRNAVTGACAAAGVLAVTLAESGTSDDVLALSTVFGEVLGERYDDRWLDEGLGSERYLRTGYLKLHACSRWNHAPIEATETILGRDAVRPEDVVDVEVATYDPATRLDGREPQTGFAGKHSIPFNVAARILLRDNGIDTYTDEVVQRPELRAVMQRVRVVEDPTMTAAAPQVRAARVTVRLHDGRVLTATEERPPGGADRPYPADVIREQASGAAAGAGAPSQKPRRCWSGATPAPARVPVGAGGARRRSTMTEGPTDPTDLSGLATAVAGTRWADAPEPVRDRVVDLVADCVAVTALGSGRAELRRLVALHDRLTPPGPSSVLGSPRGWPALSAMLLNATALAADQLQDGHRLARGHPASHVVPAVLAMAEQTGADGAEVLSAVLAGYEAGVRVGRAMGGTPAGVHDIGTWGQVAVAAATARLLAPGDAGAARRALELAGSAVLLTDAHTVFAGHAGSHTFLGSSVQSGAAQGLAAVAGLAAAPGSLAHHLGSVGRGGLGPLAAGGRRRLGDLRGARRLRQGPRHVRPPPRGQRRRRRPRRRGRARGRRHVRGGARLRRRGHLRRRWPTASSPPGSASRPRSRWRCSTAGSTRRP